MTEQEAAYIAGVLDGEGSICIVDKSHPPRMDLSLSAQNTSRELVEYLREDVRGYGRTPDYSGEESAPSVFVVD